MEIKNLINSDIKEILKLEELSWVPRLQANKEILKKRFDLGHQMMGLYKKGTLIGMLSFSYSNFNPEDYDSFPKTFKDFSSQPKTSNYNSAFFYNFEIQKNFRGGEGAFLLGQEGMRLAKEKSCKYLVGDARCSSYNGSLGFEQENIKQNFKFREAIENYINIKKMLSKQDLLEDKTINFYNKRFGLEPLWVIPNFIPEDESSGGFRIIMYKDIGGLK